jgi:hypothetical protein
MEVKRAKLAERKAQEDERHFALLQYQEDRDRRKALEERRKDIVLAAAVQAEATEVAATAAVAHENQEEK